MENLELLRDELKALNLDGFIIGSGDAHQSEYVAASDSRRQFISGFTGSAGTALVLMESAYLWTDGRYFLQAAEELSTSWTLMKSGEKDVLELEPWLLHNCNSGAKIGVDSNLISSSQAKSLEKTLAGKGLELFAIQSNKSYYCLDSLPTLAFQTQNSSLITLV